jgi:hypothetical protein
MAAFAHGSPSWVPVVTDPNEPLAVFEHDNDEDADIKKMKRLAIAGCAALVLIAAVIVFVVMRPTGTSTPPTTVAPTVAPTKAPKPGTSVPKPGSSVVKPTATNVNAPASTVKPDSTTGDATESALAD